MDTFSEEIKKRLKWYVYRLIDPRSGFTFYVGKGKDDRVFQHAKGLLPEDDGDDAETPSLKHDTIRAIMRAGLSVQYLIHRHGIETSDIAYQVEAALIDAYPGLTNLAGGHGSSIQGCRSVEQIVAAYGAAPLIAAEPLILIFVGKTYDERGGPYEAVRGVWKMSLAKAEAHRLVLAYDGAIVIGAYRPKRWLDATRANFPFLSSDRVGRIGFEGERAECWDDYVGRRVPSRRRGDMSAFRYLRAATSGSAESEDVGYAAMAADEEREREADAWSEGLVGDVGDEPG